MNFSDIKSIFQKGLSAVTDLINSLYAQIKELTEKNEDLKLLEEYKEEGKFEKFAEVGIKLIADYPHLTNSLFEVSLVLKEMRKYDQAIDLGERLRLRDAKNVANLMNLAESYHKVGKKERANSILDSYLKMYPDEERLKKLREEIQ